MFCVLTFQFCGDTASASQTHTPLWRHSVPTPLSHEEEATPIQEKGLSLFIFIIVVECINEKGYGFILMRRGYGLSVPTPIRI